MVTKKVTADTEQVAKPAKTAAVKTATLKTTVAKTAPLATAPAKTPRAAAKTKKPVVASQDTQPEYPGALDEALTETFPASDPIAASSAFDPDGSVQADANHPATPEPFHFPTAEHPHPGAQHVEPKTREERIRLAAYLRAEARGFNDGDEVDDWLAAEAEENSRPADPR